MMLRDLKFEPFNKDWVMAVIPTGSKFFVVFYAVSALAREAHGPYIIYRNIKTVPKRHDPKDKGPYEWPEYEREQNKLDALELQCMISGLKQI